ALDYLPLFGLGPGNKRSSAGPAFASVPPGYRLRKQASRFYSPPARPTGGPSKKANVRTVNRGPSGEPALPDTTPNPASAAMLSRSPGVSGRRRKLRLRERG
ncbi:MAG TPA: hypothetical protein VK364_03410, partial [Hymenobacter sp.]|nr:hypothetical protein [Hymenobacter sp.]